MKLMYRIAKTELKDLFYSPIAWLILIIFAFQTGMFFSDLVDEQVRNRVMGYVSHGNLTMTLFSGWSGLFSSVQSYLYLYIPLLTMGLMSRELGSGSIKLLYSSPVTNVQIILGKYTAMMIYGWALMAVLVMFIGYSAVTVKDLDYSIVFSGLLGVYLLMCAYSAIGLFMSSLTSYQIVAAVGTLVILAVLTYVKNMWQDIAFIRDITYWFGISGRANELVSGMICTEDLIYFIVVIFLFLGMTIIHMQNHRQRVTPFKSFSKYALIWSAAILAGYVSSRPTLMGHWDVTRTKMNSLTPGSQEVVKQLEGDLTITTYVNLCDKYFWVGIPSRVNEDFKNFKQYVSLKPEIKMNYVYYYDTVYIGEPDRAFAGMSIEEKARKIMSINKISKKLVMSPEQIHQQIDLREEGNRTVRILERKSGEKAFLRLFDDNMIFPSEMEITAALKKLIEKQPTVGFLTGHGERETDKIGERCYSTFTQMKNFRYSLVNQGFDFKTVTLDEEIPEEVNILVAAEMRQALTETEERNYRKYIERGGNLLIIGEPNRQEVMNPLVSPLGVRFMEGILVASQENLPADLMLVKPTEEAVQLTYLFRQIRDWYVCTMPSCLGLEYTGVKDFTALPLFRTDSSVWNESHITDFVEEVPVLDPNKGEVQQVYTTGLALQRPFQDKEQRIVILGDADCISNGEFSHARPGVNAANFGIVQGIFNWLSDGKIPIDIRRPELPDNQFYVSEDGAYYTKIACIGIFPGLLLLWAVALAVIRKRR